MFLFVFDPFVAAFVVSSLMVGMGIRNCVGLLLPQMNERMMILGTVQNQSQPGCWSSNTWQNWQGRGTWSDICTQRWWNKHGGGGQWASLGSGGRMTCRAGQLIELPAELVSFGQQPPSSAWKAWPACWPADAWCSCSSGRLQAWSPADCLSCKSHLLSITQSTRTPAPIRICEFPFASVPGAGTASYCCCLSDSAMHAAYRFPCWRLLWRALCLLVLHRVSACAVRLSTPLGATIGLRTGTGTGTDVLPKWMNTGTDVPLKWMNCRTFGRNLHGIKSWSHLLLLYLMWLGRGLWAAVEWNSNSWSSRVKYPQIRKTRSTFLMKIRGTGCIAERLTPPDVVATCLQGQARETTVCTQHLDVQ